MARWYIRMMATPMVRQKCGSCLQAYSTKENKVLVTDKQELDAMISALFSPENEDRTAVQIIEDYRERHKQKRLQHAQHVKEMTNESTYWLELYEPRKLRHAVTDEVYMGLAKID